MTNFNVREEDWDFAVNYLSEKPNGTKLRRKDYLQDHPEGYCQNSFIIFDTVIYAMGRDYLGQGTYSKVKLCQDKDKKIYAVKIQNGPNSKENTHENNELEVEQDLDLLIASGKRVNSEKKVHIIKFLGKNLYDYLEKEGANLSTKDIVLIFIRCVTEVEQLHNGAKSRQGKKYLHRDIKQDNFVIDEQGTISLIDFGYTCLIPEGGVVNDEDINGTKDYMAPEVWNAVYSVKSDVYALGILLDDLLGLLKEDPWPNIVALGKSMLSSEPSDRPSIESILNTAHRYLQEIKIQEALAAANAAAIIDNGDLLSQSLIYKEDTLVQRCLAAGADINKRNAQGLSPLMEAAKIGYEQGMDFLLQQPQLDFFAQDNQGRTAEDYAQNAGFGEQLKSIHKELIKRRVTAALQHPQYAAEIDRMNLLAWTAYYHCDDELIQCLRTNIDFEHITAISGHFGQVSSLLFWSIEHSNYQVAELLLFKGANLSTPNTQGILPMDAAIAKNDIKLVLLLLRAGAKLTALVQSYLWKERPLVFDELESLQKIAVSLKADTKSILDVSKTIIDLYTIHPVRHSNKLPSYEQWRLFQSASDFQEPRLRKIKELNKQIESHAASRLLQCTIL